MRGITISSCICIIVLMLALNAQVMGLDQNQAQPKVLRAGFETPKAVNNLDMQSSKPDYSSKAVSISSQKQVHSIGMLSQTAPKAAFNISQRTGMVARFTYDTGIFKPFYNVSAYTSVKPIYDVPGFVHNKPVYNIDNYPKIKAVNSIP